jgi:hypothetical protein
MRQPYAYLKAKPPYCDICTHPHWHNQPHQGNDWPARVAARVSSGQMTPEQALALGVGIVADQSVARVAQVADSGDKAGDSLLTFLKSHPNALQDEIKKGVRVRWQAVRHKLTELVGLGVVKREGAGARGEGFRYSVRGKD